MSQNTPIKNIGFIGLGNMGAPMASRLIQAGFTVTVYDVRPEPMNILHEQGAIIAQSVKQLAQHQDIIITMLQTGEQVKTICLGEAGIYQHAKPNTIHIDTSSIDVETSRLLHAQAEIHHILSLDAPVSGGIAGASKGQLTFAVGGDAATLAIARPVLDAMAKRIVYAGGPGNGQVAKICNNMILGISMIAVSEAFILAEKLGLSPEKFLEFSSNASGQCWVMTNYSPIPGLVDNVPANDGYKPGFTANLMLKDLQLSQQAAESVEMKTTLGATATQMYKDFLAQHQKNSAIDFSGILAIQE